MRDAQDHTALPWPAWPQRLFTAIRQQAAQATLAVTSLRERRRAAAAERESYTALMALSDGELWDLGLCRGDLAAMIRRRLRPW